MAKKAHYLAIDKCPHGTVALSINNDIGGTRLTGGCCGSWTTQREFPVDVDSLVALLLPYAKNDELTILRAKVDALTAANLDLTERVLYAERERDEAYEKGAANMREKAGKMLDRCSTNAGSVASTAQAAVLSIIADRLRAISLKEAE